MGSQVIVAEELTKSYFRKGRQSAQTFDAVSCVSLGLAAGELVALVGRSGSGKTTLLNMLSGLLGPTEGKVLFEGDDLYAKSDAELSQLRNAHFGVIPQGRSALASLTVLENIMMPCSMYAADTSCERRALGLLERFDIVQLSECYPHELSGGELRRMAIARALVSKPAIVFADEPTGDLDDQNTRVVLEALKSAASEGACVLVVTHEPAVEEYADRVLRMDAGKLVC